MLSPRKGSTRSSMELMEVLKISRPCLLLNASLRRKVWNVMRYLHQLLDIPPFVRSFPLLPHKDGIYIKWMSRPPSCMDHLRGKSMLKNLRGSKFKIGRHMYLGRRNPFMG